LLPMNASRTAPGHVPKVTHDFSPTPFGTGCQSMDSDAAKVWNETLNNEQRQQMKDWQVRNQSLENPLDFRRNPLPPGTIRVSDPAKAPVSIPRSAPVDTKTSFQIRDPTFVLPGDPASKPKFYAGRRSRRRSNELPGIMPCTIPGISHGLGGYRTMPLHLQQQVMNYPPPNPLAKKSQATPGSLLPGSTTFGFGNDFNRARRDAPCGRLRQYRPDNLPGELTLTEQCD